MSLTSKSATLLVAMLVLALVSPLAGIAAEKPEPWELVDVTLHSEGSNSVLLVSGRLPEDTKLPAVVELSAPAGSTVQWAGEILSGPPSEDPEVDYTVETRGDFDVYTFTLTKSLIGQVEAISPGTLMYDGQTYTANLTYAPSTPVETLRLATRVPESAQLISGDPDIETGAGGDGFAYVRRTFEKPALDEPATMAVAYTIPTAPVATGGSQGNGVIIAVLLLLFVALSALVFTGVRNKSRARTANTEWDDEGDDEPSVSPGSKTVVATADAVESEGATVADAAVDSDAPRPRRKPNLVLIVVVAAIVFAGAFAVSAGSRGVTAGDTVSMEYATVDACTTSSFALKAPSGSNLAEDAETILNSLRTVAGLGSATLDKKTGIISVGYCDSSASSDQILAALTSTGYEITPAGTGPAEQPVAPTQP